MQVSLLALIRMHFPQRLIALRKEKGLTQQAMADAVGIHVSQIKRYEAGTSQPSLEVLRKVALALSISADALLFDEHERGPDEDMQLLFEAISRFGPDEKKTARDVLEGLIIKHEAKRWSAA